VHGGGGTPSERVPVPERAADAGGALVAGPRAGGGFAIELRVPLSPAA